MTRNQLVSRQRRSFSKVVHAAISGLVIAGIVQAGQLRAQSPSLAATPVGSDLGVSTISLWPNDKGGENSTESSLTVFRPQSAKPNHAAVIIVPGGGYVTLGMNIEGRQVADWFTTRGITAFVLRYRFGPHHPYPEPLLDGQRAVRLVRSMSNDFHVDPAKIGLVGFSAGGHLAALVATTNDEGNSQAADPVERISDHPDFLVLGYAWLNAMQPNDAKKITYCSMLKGMPEDKCKDWESLYTPTLHVTSKTPPTFLYGTTDDALVPVSASLDFYSALVKVGVPTEMHLFGHGAHGSGLGGGDPNLDVWPSLLENWLREQHII